MLSKLFKFAGQVVGETVHQTGKLVDTTIETGGDIIEDISNIPSAIAEGYNQELFESKETPNEKSNSTNTTNKDQV